MAIWKRPPASQHRKPRLQRRGPSTPPKHTPSTGWLRLPPWSASGLKSAIRSPSPTRFQQASTDLPRAIGHSHRPPAVDDNKLENRTHQRPGNGRPPQKTMHNVPATLSHLVRGHASGLRTIGRRPFEKPPEPRLRTDCGLQTAAATE